MIRYHGGPIWPMEAAPHLWKCRHAMVSFAHKDQIEIAAEVSQSFTIDNGAFSLWMRSRSLAGGATKDGVAYDLDGYRSFVDKWTRHPGCDWCVIPDIIDGTEVDNDRMVSEWHLPASISVPVWHMHESLERLERLCGLFPRVAFGSSGEFSKLQTDAWWRRMCEAMDLVCVDGCPRVKIHGLRMMDPTIFSHVPFSSVDSTGVAMNIGLDCKWTGPYSPSSKTVRALVLADRCECHAAAARWSGSKGAQTNFELAG